MIGLSHAQLKVVMSATADVPVEKRSNFLGRTAAMLGVRGHGHFDDDDVADAVARALTSLSHQPAA
jgi:hypothetical protein